MIDDNNYPGSAGREFGVPDNNEFIVIHTAPLLRDCGRDDDRHDHHGWRDDRGRGKDRDCQPVKE